MTEKDPTVFVASLRHAAELIEDNPDIPFPLVNTSGTITWHLYEWDCPDGIPAAVAAIRRAVGGKWDKRESNPYYSEPEMIFEREGYRISVKREAVCVRKVVGTETVTIPALPAREAQPERTETREIVEWDCEPVLAKDVAR